MLEGITLMPTVGNIWTYPRSPVPTFLADAGVSQDVWITTYDAIVEHNNRFRDITNHARASRKWGFLSAFVTFIVFLGMFLHFDHSENNGLASILLIFMFPVPCLVAPMVAGYCSRRADGQTCSAYVVKWSRFVEEQKGVYRPFGIDCQMIKAPAVAGGAKKLVLGGVNFRPFPTPKTAASADGLVPRGSIASELESLRDLHQSGALTDDEYTQAKARALAMPPNEPIPEARAVVAESESTCAYAQVIPDSEMAGANTSSDGPDDEKTALALV